MVADVHHSLSSISVDSVNNTVVIGYLKLPDGPKPGRYVNRSWEV